MSCHARHQLPQSGATLGPWARLDPNHHPPAFSPAIQTRRVGADALLEAHGTAQPPASAIRAIAAATRADRHHLAVGVLSRAAGTAPHRPGQLAGSRQPYK